MTNPANTADFEAELDRLLAAAEELGFSAVELTAGALHRRVGGYPQGGDHRMASCCGAMRKNMRAEDRVVAEPPSGKGASLTIRYVLPR